MRLFYRRYGEGPPLVILHGLYGSSDNWVTIAKNISGNFTVYLPDLRNHGQSPHSDIHDYNSMSGDVFELITELNLGKFFLAGHSMGGKAAIRFAMRWPELLEGLLIADISPFETKTSNLASYDQHLAILKAISETDISKAASRKEIENMFLDRISSAKIRGLIMKNLFRTSDINYSWRINNSSLLRNIDRIIESVAGETGIFEPVTGFPVLFLKGENSEYLPSGDFRKISELFPSVEFRVIKNAGHWLHADNPEAVSEALLSLLNF
jgi:pimeloyl-ACP methyl ester carboxylesterase